jgi:hypothetical protein
MVRRLLWNLARSAATMSENLPGSVPCFWNRCEGQALYETTEIFPKGDARPIYLCHCGARVAVHVDELQEYIAEYTG